MRGIIIPLITEAERLEIEDPMEGEAFIQIDSIRGIYIFTPNGWLCLTPSSLISIAAMPEYYLNTNNWEDAYKWGEKSKVPDQIAATTEKLST